MRESGRRPSSEQGSLFASLEPPAEIATVADDAPLAERMRPRSVDEFAGQHHLVGAQRLLREMIEGARLHSLLLWGPPGSGKTTLARLIAAASGAHCLHFSAVLSGLKELRAAVEQARELRRRDGRPCVLFVDEIHRFNKAQQDAFLPHVEDGTVVLVGATTENPSFEVIAPLLSRCSVVVLHALEESAMATIIDRGLADRERGLGTRHQTIEPAARLFLIERAQGDARTGLNILEAASDLAVRRGEEVLALPLLEEAAQHRALHYDKSGEEHYNVISAFIKSMRGSDPDAAVYWLMRMLAAGEDPLFIARRMVIFAAEDVGNADPQALVIAVAARDAFAFVGLPEGRIPLAQAVVYLATALKSNASYRAMLAAAADVDAHGSLQVPSHLRNAPTRLMRDLGYGAGYQYAHDRENALVEHDHLPEPLSGRRYYEPSERGAEAEIRVRLARSRQGRKQGG